MQSVDVVVVGFTLCAFTAISALVDIARHVVAQPVNETLANWPQFIKRDPDSLEPTGLSGDYFEVQVLVATKEVLKSI